MPTFYYTTVIPSQRFLASEEGSLEDVPQSGCLLCLDRSAVSSCVGADGLMIEVHPEPETALSDGYQSLTFEQFEELMELCRRVADAVGKQITPNEQHTGGS